MNRVLVQGDSMGGSGASMWGIRNNDKFATIFSRVGVHIPAMSPTFTGSFEGNYGLVAWNCLYDDTGLTAFDYWDNDQWLRGNVATDTPFIDLRQRQERRRHRLEPGVDERQGLQETRRPHMWTWGQNDHNARPGHPGPGGDPNLSKDKTLPAFTYCSLDNNPGNGNRPDGDNAGGLNRYVWFQQDDSIDTAATWEMTCLLISSGPAGHLHRRRHPAPLPGLQAGSRHGLQLDQHRPDHRHGHRQRHRHGRCQRPGHAAAGDRRQEQEPHPDHHGRALDRRHQQGRLRQRRRPAGCW